MTPDDDGLPARRPVKQLEINKAVKSVDGITECDINLVWEPAWDMSKMSRFAKIALGIHG